MKKKTTKEHNKKERKKKKLQNQSSSVIGVYVCIYTKNYFRSKDRFLSNCLARYKCCHSFQLYGNRIWISNEESRENRNTQTLQDTSETVINILVFFISSLLRLQ